MNNLSPQKYQSYEDFKKGENLTNEEASSLWMDMVIRRDVDVRTVKREPIIYLYIDSIVRVYYKTTHPNYKKPATRCTDCGKKLYAGNFCKKHFEEHYKNKS